MMAKTFIHYVFILTFVSVSFTSISYAKGMFKQGRREDADGNEIIQSRSRIDKFIDQSGIDNNTFRDPMRDFELPKWRLPAKPPKAPPSSKISLSFTRSHHPNESHEQSRQNINGILTELVVDEFIQVSGNDNNSRSLARDLVLPSKVTRQPTPKPTKIPTYNPTAIVSNLMNFCFLYLSEYAYI